MRSDCIAVAIAEVGAVAGIAVRGVAVTRKASEVGLSEGQEMQLVLSWLQSRPLRLQPDAAATPATPAKCAVSLTPLLSLENLVFPLMLTHYLSIRRGCHNIPSTIRPTVIVIMAAQAASFLLSLFNQRLRNAFQSLLLRCKTGLSLALLALSR